MAECVQAQKNNLKKFARAEKKRSRVKKTCAFSNGRANNIVAVCASAEKKTWKNVDLHRKNVAELKKHAPFRNGRVNYNNYCGRACASAEKKVKRFARAEKKRRRIKKNMRLFEMEE